MSMDESYLLLVVLFGIMLLITYLHPTNYIYHAFWLLFITWYGVIAMNNTEDSIVFGLILILFNVIYQLTYIFSLFGKVKEE